MSEIVEDIKRSRDHQRDRVKQLKKARNQNAAGLAYWRERAMQLEAELTADGVERDSIIEECAANLAIWYPDHACTNAFCAALRSMKSPTDTGSVT